MGCKICSSKKNLVVLNDFKLCKNCIISLNYLLENKNFIKKNKQILEIENNEDENESSNNKLFPKEIIKLFNENIVGQEKAKEKLAVVIYNHYKRVYENVDIKKSNTFLIGPTASGKTEFARQMSKILDVPLAIIDSSALTASGYIGKDIDDIFVSLLNAAGDDIEKAEKGIVFLDEIDKIAKRSDRQGERDIKGEAVQQNLLKVLEDGTYYLKSEGIEIDTSNILFIAAGAFSDFDEFVSKDDEKSLGFLKDETKHSKKNIYDENEIIKKLKSYGFIPEFLGRFSNFVILQKLTKDEIIKILKLKNSELKNYIELLKSEGIEVQIQDSFYDKIAKRIMENNVGARGLKQEIDKEFQEIILNIDNPKEKIILK